MGGRLRGQNMPNSGLVVIQCRYGSRRLPGKALYPLGGLPMVAFLARRLAKAGKTWPVVLATTQLAEDDTVAAWAEHESLKVVRGESEDVLARYLLCLETCGADFAIRVTADNPLTCPGVIERVFQEMSRGSWDYLDAMAGWPKGAGVDAFGRKTLERCHDLARGPADREHINLYILEHPDLFTRRSLTPAPAEARADLNFSVDTREEWLRMAGLLSGVAEPWKMSLEDAIRRADGSTL